MVTVRIYKRECVTLGEHKNVGDENGVRGISHEVDQGVESFWIEKIKWN